MECWRAWFDGSRSFRIRVVTTSKGGELAQQQELVTGRGVALVAPFQGLAFDWGAKRILQNQPLYVSRHSEKIRSRASAHAKERSLHALID
jgi:hypothetical protein